MFLSGKWALTLLFLLHGRQWAEIMDRDAWPTEEHREGAWAQEALSVGLDGWCPWGSCQGSAKQRPPQYINPAQLPVETQAWQTE